MAILTFFLFIIIPYAVSFSFNLTNFSPSSHEIVLDGEASISAGQIHVTRQNASENTSSYAGRATYIRPLHLWSSNTTEVASFSTSFSFVIDSSDKQNYSDGLTFFLAEHNDVLAAGRGLGLPLNDTASVRTQFVAVEFDTFDGNDSVDDASVGEHVGINIQNLTSVSSMRWLTDIPNGRECEAWISYDSLSKNLSVSFTNFQNNALVRQDGLSHTIDLRHELPEWVIFGFSAATGGWFEKHSVTSWRFNSSDLLIDRNNYLRPTKRGNKTGHVAGLIVGLSVCVIFLAILAFVLWKKKKNYEGEVEELLFAVEMSNEFEIGTTGPRRFSYVELARSTANFAENEKLGEGGFGAVYKGFLKDSRTYMAVKRVSDTSRQGFKEYASEVRIISRVRHRNLVQLVGWCHQKGKLLLVYEFMENGSLDLHLFKGKSLLTWSARYKIANGLASALLYLHVECTQCVLHRDIKSSNVMLDSNFNAKLGDFGLAKLVDHEKGSKTTILAGTMGYMAPEYVATGKASKESDVFSFGVVALEIACGRKPIETTAQENEVGLLEWVWELYGMGTLLKAVDPRLRSDFDKEEIKRLMMVGMWCVHPDLDRRPSMRQVIQVLNSEASLPILPSKMPVASYFRPPESPLIGGSGVNLSNQKTSCTTSSYRYGR